MTTTLDGLKVSSPPTSRGGTGTGSRSVSAVLIDRRALTRQCLSLWLENGSPDLRVVPLGSPAELLNAFQSISDPRMIVFSIGATSVKDPSVFGPMTLLRRHFGRIPLVLLSDLEDVDQIVAAMEQGVRGYITTSLDPSEAAAALHCIEAGGTFVPVSALIKFAQDSMNGSRLAHESQINPLQSLTPRESEVLACLRQGKPNKVIAHELKISESTVKVFVRRILFKLHASNRTEAACLPRGQLGSNGGVREHV